MPPSTLSPALLAALGLLGTTGCGTFSACLKIAVEDTDPDTGPCLSPPYDTSDTGDTDTDTDTGPCLSPVETGDTSDTSDTADTSETADTSPDTSADTADTAVGPCLEAPMEATEPAVFGALTRGLVTTGAAARDAAEAALEAVLARDVLPEDVAARLRARLGPK